MQDYMVIYTLNLLQQIMLGEKYSFAIVH